MVRCAAFVLALLCSPIANSAAAHPLHVSYTEVTRDRTGRIAISTRLFADDFGAFLDSLRVRPEWKGQSREAVARDYLRRKVRLSAKGGVALALSWCGMRTVDGMTRVCLRSEGSMPAGVLELRLDVLFDRFPDQVSLVRWNGSSRPRTMALTPRMPAGRLE